MYGVRIYLFLQILNFCIYFSILFYFTRTFFKAFSWDSNSSYKHTKYCDSTWQLLLCQIARLQLKVCKLWLTFEFVVLRVCREEAIREEFGEGQASVFWPVLHIVTHRRLQFLHELRRGRAELLYNLIPLVDVWKWVESWKKHLRTALRLAVYALYKVWYFTFKWSIKWR